MKYSIHGFSQQKAMELGLSNDDLLVLRWFVDFAGTDRMKTMLDNEGVYYWVNYSTVLEDLPVLNVSKRTLKRKRKKARLPLEISAVILWMLLKSRRKQRK